MPTDTLARKAIFGSPHARLRANLRSVLVALRWTSALYAAPGMLLVGLLVIGWILPAFLIIAVLLAAQFFVYRTLVLVAAPRNYRKIARASDSFDGRGEDAFTRRQRMLS